ncbi:uncharacterized protein RSE6_01788 [Rhynchosporium secalis]|uniref:Uncharacterized protein n=1 Tax=Rhynchosporium secalis TaxID=38038 RepID=A0A1E1LYL2_RHYSE|nr:uncharacterized protein RSE6_01788 [Rhynchosporium secalis]
MSAPSPPPGPGPPSHSFFTLRELKKREPTTTPIPQISISYSADAKRDMGPTSSSSMDLGPSLGQGAALGPQQTHKIATWGQGWSTPAPRSRSASPETGSPVPSRVLVSPSPSDALNRARQLHPRVRGTDHAAQIQQPRPFTSDDVMASVANRDISTNVAKEFSQLAIGKMGDKSGTPPDVPGTRMRIKSKPNRLSSAASSTTDTYSEDSKTSSRNTPKITLQQVTEMLRSTINNNSTPASVRNFQRRELYFSVAFYTPQGYFLPPMQSLMVNRLMSFRGLIAKLQRFLYDNLLDSRLTAKLLVQSVQVRVFEGHLKYLPRIEGWICGLDEEENETTTLGPSEVAKGTRWVAWEATDTHGKQKGAAEDFWNTVVERMVRDLYKLQDPSKNHVGDRPPMLKIRTVAHLHSELRSQGDGQIFYLPPDAVLPTPAFVVTNITSGGSIASDGSGGSDAEMKDQKSNLQRLAEDKREITQLQPGFDHLSQPNPLHHNNATRGTSNSTMGTDEKVAESAFGQASLGLPKTSNVPERSVMLNPFANPFARNPKHGRGSPDSMASTPSTQRQKTGRPKEHKIHRGKGPRISRRPQPLGQSLGSYLPPDVFDGSLDDATEAFEYVSLIASSSIGNSKNDTASELKEMEANLEPPPSCTSTNEKGNLDEPENKMSRCEEDYYSRVITLGSSFGDSRSFWVEKGGYPKNVPMPMDPKHNWEMYQHWGEKPSDEGYEDKKLIHDWFSLSHIPFYGPVCEPWSKGKRTERIVDESGEGDDENAAADSCTSVPMLPYTPLDPKILAQLTLEFLSQPSNLPLRTQKYWEDQENMKGLTEIDDDIFFPASNPELVRRHEASKVFQARAFRNPSRTKFDLASVLGATERRVSSNHSKYLDALAAEKGSNSDVYETMPSEIFRTAAPKLGTNKTATTFNHSHAAANNVFQSTMKGVGSFSSFSKQDFSPNAHGGPGFYELSRGIANHTPAREADSFIADFHPNTHGAEMQNKVAGDSEQTFFPRSSFSDFSAMANEFGTNQNASVQAEFAGTGNGNDDSGGYDFRPGNVTWDGRISNTAMNGPRGGGNSQIPNSFDMSSRMSGGGPADYRNSIPYDTQQLTGYPNNQGWTSMNTAGATYNSFGSQAHSYNGPSHSTIQARYTSAFPQYNSFSQQAYAAPTAPARMQSRFFNPTDSNRGNPGHERFAFNNMAMTPSNTNHPPVGSFVNPHTNLQYPSTGSFYHGGNGPNNPHSRTHGLHVESNPTALSRARRPIPIRLPPGNGLHATTQQFQLPSPTRQAINYGAGPDRASLGLGSGLGTGTSVILPPFVRRTPSPEKKAFQKASMDALSAAIETAFNGPKGSPSARKKA